ncbi:MAG: class I SAM-dependent methyltransferase [Gammaproteobacteria bacterium]
MSSKWLIALVFITSLNAHAIQPTHPYVAYVPTPQPVVYHMLELADVRRDDMVYDLGSGDGRIVISAAKRYGARGVGIDIDPRRVHEARENAHKAGVHGRVTFRQADLFETDLSPATVVTLYLLPSVNERLMPKLLDELAPGTPIVSHDFAIGDWKPQHTENMDGHVIYMWTVPQPN